jgi:hypothetical protein
MSDWRKSAAFRPNSAVMRIRTALGRASAKLGDIWLAAASNLSQSLMLGCEPARGATHSGIIRWAAISAMELHHRSIWTGETSIPARSNKTAPAPMRAASAIWRSIWVKHPRSAAESDIAGRASSTAETIRPLSANASRWSAGRLTSPFISTWVYPSSAARDNAAGTGPERASRTSASAGPSIDNPAGRSAPELPLRDQPRAQPFDSPSGGPV